MRSFRSASHALSSGGRPGCSTGPRFTPIAAGPLPAGTYDVWLDLPLLGGPIRAGVKVAVAK